MYVDIVMSPTPFFLEAPMDTGRIGHPFGGQPRHSNCHMNRSSLARLATSTTTAPRDGDDDHDHDHRRDRLRHGTDRRGGALGPRIRAAGLHLRDHEPLPVHELHKGTRRWTTCGAHRRVLHAAGQRGAVPADVPVRGAQRRRGVVRARRQQDPGLGTARRLQSEHPDA